MPDFGSIAKDGWHPKGKDGGKESWRGDFKGIDQVAKWMGKGDRKTEDSDRRAAHPITSLKDPSTFAPPPKRTPGVPIPASRPLQKQIASTSHTQYDNTNVEVEEEERKVPSLPFRANTTGLRTDHLPPPPGRKDGADGRKATAGVEVLTTANFDQFVFNGEGKPTLVQFYSPHCMYCQQLEPIYEQLAATFLPYSNVISIAKLDCFEHKKLGARFGITSYPTIKYFNGKNGISEDYVAGRDIESLTAFVTDKTNIRPGVKQPVSRTRIAPPPPATKAKPGLPPRLPARQNSIPNEFSTAPPPAYTATDANTSSAPATMNERAMNRLGVAGVSVPAFGIGAAAKKPVLAPPPPPRTQSSSSTTSNGNVESMTAPKFGTAQISEFSTRFSKLNTSQSRSESAPKQGTSFAEKQAALRTAQSFQKDPSSISFAEARAAASTANNFRERHGDQVAAGYKSANKLNNKYGIADKAGKYSSIAMGIPTPPVSAQNEDTTQVERNASTPPTTVKKAPPPPPKRKPAFAPAADAGEGPPPVPLTSKPRPTVQNEATRNNHRRDNLDLDLKSLWFTKGVFPPPSIANLPGGRGYASSSGWSSSGNRKTHTMNIFVRHNDDLSGTKIRLVWDGNNPGLSVKAEQRYIPPPRVLSSAELEEYRTQYSDRIARWCESKMGTQVGNGECWTLAHEALKAIAAENSSRGAEPCLTSQSLIHGYKIYQFLPPAPCEPAGGVRAAGVARGDIIQYLSAHFKHSNGGQSWAGAPDHTAVVTGVERDGSLAIVQSNSGGVKTVQVAKVDFRDLVGGEIRIFRAVAESWVGAMDPSWP